MNSANYGIPQAVVESRDILLWKSVTAMRELDASAKVLHGYMFSKQLRGKRIPSYRAMARELHLSKSTVTVQVAALVRAGLIRKGLATGGAPNTIEVLMPDELPHLWQNQE